MPGPSARTRSRRASTAFPTLPRRVRRRPRRRARGARARLPADARGGDRRPRPAAARLERGDQPDRDPRPGRRSPSATSSTASRRCRVLRARGASSASSTSAAAAAIPGIPLAAALAGPSALLVDSVGKKARFLATAVDGDGPRGTGRGRAASAPRRSRATPRIASAGRRSPPGPSAALAELVELAFPLLAPGGVLVAWKRGDPSDARARRRAGAARRGDRRRRPAVEVERPRRAAGGSTGDRRSSDRRSPARRRRARPPADRPPAGRATRPPAGAGPGDAPLRRRPRALGSAGARRRPVGHPRQSRRPRRRPRRGRLGRRRLAPRRRRRLRARAGRRSSRGWPRRARSASPATTIAAAVGGREIDWFNPDARAAMEWTRDARSRRRPRDWLAGPARAPDRGRRPSLVHGSPRDPVWEYITSVAVARANLDGADDAGSGCFGHTHLPMAWTASDDGRDRAGRARPRRRRSRSTAGAAAAQPGQRRPAARRRPAAASWLVLDTDAAHGHVASRRLRHRARPGGDARRRPAGAPRRAAAASACDGAPTS